MFPLTFQSACVLKISLVHNFTRTHLYLERHRYEIILCAKNIFVRIYVRFKFSCVCSSHGLCVRAQAHTQALRGNIEAHAFVYGSCYG